MLYQIYILFKIYISVPMCCIKYILFKIYISVPMCCIRYIYCLRYIYVPICCIKYIYCLRYIYLFLYVVSNIPKLHQIPGIYIMNTTTQTFITGKGNAGNKFPIWEFSIQKYTEKGSIYTFIEFHIEFILIIKTLVK